MNVSTELPVLLTALFAGILGSGHCFGMCGGIAGTLGALGGGTGRARFAPALLFNSGRVASYVLLGGVLALVLGGVGEMLSVPRWARALRIVTAVMILLIGLRFLFDFSLLARLERLGGGVWQRIRPVALRFSARPGAFGRFMVGVCWGFLPCGLVYTMLLTAASTGRFYTGAAVMLAFGAGTLPSMVGLSIAAPALGAILQERWVRRVIGLALILLAAWTLVMMGSAPMHHG